MIVKELICVLLLSGSLQILASDNTDKSSETNYNELQDKQTSEFLHHKKKLKDAELQFQKDYSKWGDKKSVKYEFKEAGDSGSHMNLNEIDSNEYVDKYNKYGHTFKLNPNLLYSQKEKTAYHKKMALEDEKHVKYHEKPVSLHRDININYVDNKKEMSGDSEFFTDNTEKPKSLLHDIDVNYVNNKKEMSGDSEFFTDNTEKPKSLLHDIDVNYVNNKKEMSGDSEFITENPEKPRSLLHDIDVSYVNNKAELLEDKKSMHKSKEEYQRNYQNGKELYMKRFKKDFYQNLIKIDTSKPPPANDTIAMARYIVHTVDWAALGTLSGRSPTKGSPFVCVKATSDGVESMSSGVPLFYMSPMDLCTQDLQKDNRVSVLVTLSETEYCKNQNYDPQDPRCAKLTLSGKIKKIKAGSEEEKFAKNALFSRHPAMESWPADHDWYFTKLKIGQIVLLDQFGGATYIKVKDYLNGKVTEPELKK